jgi:hypothetical protein
MNDAKRKFLSYKTSDSPSAVKQCFDDYKKYLFSMRERFPENAFSFAQADWHYNPEDSRCPHDAWLEAMEIIEEKTSESSSKRNTNIKIKLLGAYHNGIITIFYKQVKYYCLGKFPYKDNDDFGLKKAVNFHGDWLVDEIYLSEESLVIHDIEFANKVRWIIHCEDIEYNWNPFEGESQGTL